MDVEGEIGKLWERVTALEAKDSGASAAGDIERIKSALADAGHTLRKSAAAAAQAEEKPQAEGKEAAGPGETEPGAAEGAGAATA